MEIYTTYPFLQLKNEEDFMFSYKELGAKKVKWVDEQIIRMTTYEKSPAEKAFELKMHDTYAGRAMIPQVYLAIRDDKGRFKEVFLDYIIPNVEAAYNRTESYAIEVDGKYHIQRAEEDWQRDNLLWKIGIKTLRFTFAEIKREDFIHYYFKRFGAAREMIANYDSYIVNFKDSNTNRYFGKDTHNQKLLKLILDILESSQPNSYVVFRTKDYFVLTAFDREKRERLPGPLSITEQLIDRCKSVCAEKGIAPVFRYVGRRDRLQGKAAKVVEWHDSVLRNAILSNHPSLAQEYPLFCS